MTIGLEIHAELKTKSKMFCGCRNAPLEKKPNLNVCPICMGHPGTLPTINKEAVKKVIMVGLALEGKIADLTYFDRKNYFYPDIPKGYQISQYKNPLISGGLLSGVAITRVHLEEDTARSTHEGKEASLVDFNRAGLPLMELVTEPVMHSAEEAMNFAKELQLLLQYLEASDANMEKGEMRVEVNISVSKDENFGTKVEVKNINSFKAAGRAIEYEFKRQTEVLERGERVLQETRGFDENKCLTVSQRSKEDAHDYRYFPEPDLPKLKIGEIPEFDLSKLKKELKETPQQKRIRLKSSFGLKDADIETYISNTGAGDYFTSVSSVLSQDEMQLASNYIVSDLIGLSKTKGLEFDSGKLENASFSKIIKMISRGDLSSRGAKDLLKIIFEDGGDPEAIAKEKNLIQKNDPEEFKRIIRKIIEDNPKVVEEYKSGKESVLQFFVGQAMKETKGQGNPESLKVIIKELLK